IDMARRLGVTSDLEPLPSIALGSTELTLLELTTAYAHLAAGGNIVYPYGILAIDTAHGEPVYRRQASGGVVLRPSIVGEMNEMLLGVVNHGTGRAAQIGRPVAGKTGTTSDYRDAWFIGFAPQLVTGVWVGNDDNTPMKKVTGGMLPASIWHHFMQVALEHLPVAGIPTSGSSFVSLPWQSETPAYPPQPGEPHVNSPPPQSGPRTVTLGKSFWDKLFAAPPR
ncbi:MAG: hypothetical protein KGJ06_00640, partial [Pseudomonadota bacterium]|nr:hypothetical protein [Pseudomonadota bacterium]